MIASHPRPLRRPAECVAIVILQRWRAAGATGYTMAHGAPAPVFGGSGVPIDWMAIDMVAGALMRGYRYVTDADGVPWPTGGDA